MSNTNTSEFSTNSLPKVVFFDAMGTLFGLKHSVGEIYQQYAAKHGVRADAELLDRAFIKSFKSAPPLAFSNTESTKISAKEFDWWQNLVQATFFELNLVEKFSDFTGFFSDVYTYFSTEEPWYVFPDTVPCLEKLKDNGVQLGIISNFDTRLISVLNSLKLEHFFTSTTISSVAGFAKPDHNIFKIALAKHQFNAEQAWHIGDSLVEDYQGGKNAGINSFLLNRNSHVLNLENELPNLSSLG